MTVTGEASTTSVADITSANLELATFRFQVKSAASAGTYSAINAVALTMVNKVGWCKLNRNPR